MPGSIRQELIINGTASGITQKYSNLGSDNPFKGPTARSLFYEGAKRTPGKYGQFLFYSFGSLENNFIDAYYRSELPKYNKKISSLDSKNPSAGFLVRETDRLRSQGESSILNTNGFNGKFERSIIGGLSAPYFWKDFLYCKYYGAIPNNYMVTLRRFPNPTLDNFSMPDRIKSTGVYLTEGLGRPVAQAVTWMGGNTGNTIKALTQFSTGIKWDVKNQSDVPIVQEAFSKGAFLDKPYGMLNDALGKISPEATQVTDWLAKSLESAALVFDPNNTTVENDREFKLRDLAKTKGGILSEFIWTSVDTISTTYMRGRGLPFTWGGQNVMSLVFEYELTSVGEVNTKAAMLDLMANLLSIGTNYGNFLTPNFRYQSNFPAIGFPGGDKGLEDFYRDPLTWFATYGEQVLNGFSVTASSTGATDPNGGQGQITRTIFTAGGNTPAGNAQSAEIQSALAVISENGNLNESGKIGAAAKAIQKAVGGTKGAEAANRFLKNMLTPDLIAKYQVPMAFFTGAPIGEWHLTVGNPCNPIALIGNLLCDGVAIEFGETLGPDDFPTHMKATFTLRHGRDRERGEIESIFNRGDGRLYQSSLPTSSTMQSNDAVADTAGNVGLYAGTNANLNIDSFRNSIPANRNN